jgi:hypothetical protein
MSLKIDFMKKFIVRNPAEIILDTNDIQLSYIK